MNSPALILSLVIALIALITVARSVRVVNQSSNGIIERLGRYQRTLGPGIHVLVPFVDRLRRPLVDMREQIVSFPPQPSITSDNVTVDIDTVLYYRITDPVAATYEVSDLLVAIEQLALTGLRNQLGQLSLDEALTSREQVNSALRTALDEATQRWGVRVERVEIKAIDPPTTVQQAMEKQMSAERDKRAVILRAEGERDSAILAADGRRQAAIMDAEGERDAEIARAEGDAKAAETRADGEAKANQAILQSLATEKGDAAGRMIALRYLEQLPRLAEGQSNSLVLLPSDALGQFSQMTALGAAIGTGGAVAAGEVPDAPVIPPVAGEGTR